MGGVLQGLSQAVSGGIRGWERASEWQRQDAAEKERKRLREEDINWRQGLKDLDAQEEAAKKGVPQVRWDAQDPEPAPRPDPVAMAANTTQAAPPPQQALPIPSNVPSGSPLDPNLARGGPLVPAAASAATNYGDAGGLPGGPLVSAPVSAPGAAPYYPPALPPTDTQKAAAAVAPPPQAMPVPTALKDETPVKDMVNVEDRFTGEPRAVPKSETVPMTPYDWAVKRAAHHRKFGREDLAASALQQYAVQHEQEIEQMGRDAEIGIINAAVHNDPRGLQALSANNPIGVGFELTKNAEGQMAFGLNPRGTVAPTVYLSPTGEMSTKPVYMGLAEITMLARGAATGNMSGAVSTMADIQSKFANIAQSRQATEASKAQVRDAASDTMISAYNSYNTAVQVADQTGGVAPDFGQLAKAFNLNPEQMSTVQGWVDNPATAPASGGTGLPGGTGGRGGFLDTLAQVESGDRNIPSGVDSDVAGPGTKSQGHFQINTPTWRDFAPKAGVDLKQYPNAMSAPRDVQAQVATAIPFGRFGPRTQRMMTAQYGPLDKKATVGALAAAHGGGGGGAGTGLPGGSTPSQGSAPSGTLSDLNIKRDPKFAAAVQYTTRPKLDAGVTRAQENADQAGNQARAAAAKAAEAAGTPLDAAGGEQAYNAGRNQYISNFVNNLSEGDRTLMLPQLLPNAQRTGGGTTPTGPTDAAMKASNPFAIDGEAQGVHMMRQVMAMKDKPAGEVSPEMRQWRNQLHALRTQAPNYHDKLMAAAKKAGPLGKEPVASPKARASKNIFATDTTKAVSMVQGIMPYMTGSGYGMVPSPDAKAKLKAFDDLRKLDPQFAAHIERVARDKAGALGRAGMSRAGM